MKLRPAPLLLVLATVAGVSAWLGLSLGGRMLSPVEVWRALDGRGDRVVATVVLDLRLPRAVAAFATGGLLALSGALLQVLLRNPLADPYVLGVSGGAAVAALGAMALGGGVAWLPLWAFGGAVAATALVLVLARGPGAWSPQRMLLTGVVLASGWGAIISFILALSPDAGLRGMLFWLLGDLGGRQHPWPALAILIVATGALLPAARSLNLLGRGALQARALGVAAGALQMGVFLTASLLTAIAVSVAGPVGFVGLIVPHALRLVGATDHRVLLPAAALAGGSLLLLADTLARSLLAPVQLPVGVLTAFLGVPTFLLLLRRGARTG